MFDLEPEDIDAVIDRMTKDLEIIRMSQELSGVLVKAFNCRRTYRCTFCRFRVIIPVAGTQQAAVLYAEMGLN